MTNENEYAKKMKAVGTKLKSLRHSLRESIGLERTPFRETFKTNRPKLINLDKEEPQHQRTQPPVRERIVYVNEKGEAIKVEEPTIPTQSDQQPQPTSYPQPLAPPPRTQQTVPNVREKLMGFQGGSFLKGFREGPIRKSFGRFIDSVSERVSPQPSQQPQTPQIPQEAKPTEEEPRPEITAYIDGVKTRDKKSEQKSIHVSP